MSEHRKKIKAYRRLLAAKTVYRYRPDQELDNSTPDEADLSNMDTELLKIIDRLPGESFFYLEDGPLKSKLVESYMEQEDAHCEILEFEHNASMLIKRDGQGALFECRLEAGEFRYRALWSAADFTAEESAELIERLRPHCSVLLHKTGGSGRNIVRKKQGQGLLNISAAATALHLSHRALKSLIPCRKVRIEGEGNDRSIKEYYWDEQLIGRLGRLWLKQDEGRGYGSEDLNFVAECCCDGDRRWARDVITGFLNQRRRCED